MTTALLIIFSAMCVWLLLIGFKDPKKMYEYPFLAGCVFVGWVLPQFIGLSYDESLPRFALDKTIVMTTFCALACKFGYSANKRPLILFNYRFNYSRLIQSAAVLSLIGAYFFYEVSLLDEAATTAAEGTGLGWSGIVTIYVFFSTMLSMGLVVGLICYMQSRSRITLIIIIFDLLFYFDRIVMKGRRQAMVELFVIATITFWIFRRKIIPRLIMVGILVFGSLIINSIGDYRNVVLDKNLNGEIGAIVQIDFVGNLKILLLTGGMELRNAVYNIEATDRRMNFDFGLSHWNQFVLAYIPGQIIGADVKQHMLIDLDEAAAVEFLRQKNEGGSTPTGMSDTFASFWYFGAIKFFIISFIMSKLYHAAMRGHFIAQVLVMLVLVGALESITHGTDRFFMVWPRLIAFIVPVIWYARSRRI